MLTIRKATWSSFARSPAGRSPEAPYFYSVRLPAPPGHECPGYASTEKPGEPGSWKSGSDFGAGFSRLFVSNVARAFMPGRGGRSQSGKVELRFPQQIHQHGHLRLDPGHDRGIAVGGEEAGVE